MNVTEGAKILRQRIEAKTERKLEPPRPAVAQPPADDSELVSRILPWTRSGPVRAAS
jgi:hypothetical protein